MRCGLPPSYLSIIRAIPGTQIRAGLHDIELAYNASSDAVLYSTNPSAAVPEHATWWRLTAIADNLGVR